MRLRKKHINKQAVALAIAASVAVSVPVSANAQVSWDAKNGTVTVSKTENGVKSSQSGNSGKNDKGESVTESEDPDIKIVGDKVKDDSGNDTDKYDDSTTESTDTIVKVEEGVKDAKITIEGVDNKTSSGNAIEIGSGADVDLTINDTDITLDDKASAGIKVDAGTEDADTGEGHTKVDITVEGNNTIKNEKSYNAGGNGLGEGIAIGGYSDDDVEETYADATISGSGTLNIKDASVGIDIKSDSTLEIKDGVTVNIEDVHNTLDGGRTVKDENGNEKTVYYNYTVSGRGIMNYGELTITGKGTKVNIKNADNIGISSKGDGKDDDEDDKKNGNVTISNGATVTIEDAENQGAIYVEGGQIGDDDLLIDNATVTVKDSANGIVNETSDITIKNNAKVNISEVFYTNEKGEKVGFGIDSGHDLSIESGSEVKIADSAYGLYNHSTNDGKTVVDKAKVSITNTDHNAISTEKGDIKIKNGADVDITKAKTGISLNGGSKLSILNKWTTVDVSGTSYAGILAQNGCAMSVEDYAKLHIEQSVGAGSIDMEGSDNKLTVKNATVETTRRITSQSVADGKNNTIEILGGAKVVTPYIYNVDNNAAKLNVYITGGTLTLNGEASKTNQIGVNEMNTLAELKPDKTVWPTNTTANGNEKLVNFKLNKTNLKNFVTTLGAEYTISNDGNTLTFTAYGYDKIDNALKEYSYVVDLGKYDDDEDIDVWVPAVILDYYYPFDELPETEADAIVEDKAYTNNGKYDVIMRGHSIAFATLKDDGTTSDYTTGNMTSDDVLVNKTKTWYYWDATENDGKGAWKVFSNTTPLKVYKLGNTLSEAKPIVGIHTHVWDEKEEDRLNVKPSDCRYHGTADERCLDSDCKELHKITLPLIAHDWETSSDVELTQSADDSTIWLDDEGNKYHIDADGSVWKIITEPTYEAEGEEMLVCTRYPGESAIEGNEGETDHFTTRPIAKLQKPDEKPDEKPDNKPKDDNNDNNDKKNTDDSVPVVPAVVPVTPETPAVTPEAPVVTPETPAAEPVAETPAAPAPAETTPAAPATSKLPQTGAALFESIGLAAAGLALSIGSLLGRGKHGKK